MKLKVVRKTKHAVCTTILSGLIFAILAVIFFEPLFISPQKVFAATTDVVINELMPNPVGLDPGNEWIELYNPTSVNINLSGWILKDKTSFFSLDGQSIDPYSYLVVFPSITLNNTNEEITLLDHLGNSDSIKYSTSIEGISLERISHECNDLKLHPHSHSKGMINQAYDQDYCFTSGVEILSKEETSSDWEQNNSYFLNSRIIFRAEVTINSSIEEFEWTYGGKTLLSSQPVFTADSIGNRNIELKLTFDSGKVIRKTAQITIEPRIYLNEILPDPVGNDSGNEWIELYNPDSFEVDLSNWKIDIGSKTQKIEATKIKPKSFVIILSKNSIPNTSAKTSLFNPSGLISDSFQYVETETGKSWARTTDGEGDWEILEPTKGITNLISTISNNEKTENPHTYEFVDNKELLEIELQSPRQYSFLETKQLQQDSHTIVINKVSKVGFAGIMSSEIIIYLGMILSKEELNKIVSIVIRLIKG
ncbi:lamin tail domain-containing protein [Candidatus Dojkabacteria bacterium]|nr:lamin tail domain-containing protein [Candidatus Dojkabacteria bacterium]